MTKTCSRFGGIALVVAAGGLAFFAGCGGDENSGSTTETGGDLPTGFAVSVSVFSNDFSDTSTFIALTDDLSRGEVTLGDALERSGSSRVAGFPGTGEIYVSNAEALDITKYSISAAGDFTELERIGLLGEGITSVRTAILKLDSPDHGWLFALFSARVLDLDLENMKIIRAIDVSDWLVSSTEPSLLSQQLLERDGKWVASVYATDEVQETVSENSKMLYFDPTTGDAELVDAPCGGISHGMLTDGDEVVFSTGPFLAAIHAIDSTRAPEPCTIRVPSGTTTPSTDVIRMNDLTGFPTGGLIPSGPNTAFMRVINTDNFPLTDESTGIGLFGSPIWDTYEIDFDAPTSMTKIERDLTLSGGITFFNIGGNVYENVSTVDFATTVLHRTTGDDAPAAGLSLPGITFDVIPL